MAEINDTAQSIRASIGRDLVRSGDARQGGRVIEERRQDADAAISRAVREREEDEQARGIESRRRDEERRAEFQTRSQRQIELAADGSFNSNLPRGSIIDILV